jgi:hypothetical protein
MQAVRYGSPLRNQQWQQQQEEEELHGECETRSAAAAAAAGLRISSASPNRTNASWHSTTTFTAQQQQKWRPSSAGAAAAAAAGGQHARSYWGSMPGYASSSQCSQEGAADTSAFTAQQQACTQEVPSRPLASPSKLHGGVAGSFDARAEIGISAGSGAATGVAARVVPPTERYAALVAGADAALRQLAECRRAAAAHDAGRSCAAFGSGRSGIGARFVTSDPASRQNAGTERTHVLQAATDHTSRLPGQQLDSSSAFHSKHSQAIAARLTPAAAVGAGVSAVADSSSSSLRWCASHEVRGNSSLTAGAGVPERAGVGGSGDNGGSSARWHEMRAELQAMDGDLDAAEAALQAATARLGSRY